MPVRPATSTGLRSPTRFALTQARPGSHCPLRAAELTTPYDALYAPGAVPVQPLDRGSLGIFFELSLGLTAWKQAGTSRWALRANPSSGNLHPTEGYAVVPPLAQIDAGLYHYLARDHTLERRATLTTEAAARLVALLPVGGFLVGLSSIHWREAWKYGERAFRYCQHDTGHAIAALRYAAGALGWRALLWDGLGDDRVSALLGLDREADFAERGGGRPGAPRCCAPDLPRRHRAGFQSDGERAGERRRGSRGTDTRWRLERAGQSRSAPRTSSGKPSTSSPVPLAARPARRRRLALAPPCPRSPVRGPVAVLRPPR